MKPLILGIDPGACGGFCEIWPDGKVDAFPMFDDVDMLDYIKCLGNRCFAEQVPVTCFLELVSGYIGKAQPGSSMFKFGNGYGYIRGLIAAAGFKTILVRPQEWQKGIPGVQGIKGPERKRALKEHAARLFPNTKVTLSTADALLIADWGTKQIL